MATADWWREYRKDLDGAYRQRRTRNREIIKKAKEIPCADCDVRYPHYVMDFDHVRDEKRFTVSRLLDCSVERLLDEIAKCDVVCANCHRLRTWARQQHLGRSAIR